MEIDAVCAGAKILHLLQQRLKKAGGVRVNNRVSWGNRTSKS
jgi:hypothetical protein